MDDDTAFVLSFVIVTVVLTVFFCVSSQQILDEYLKTNGRMPLPPYVHRKQEDTAIIQNLDRTRYQTVYASRSGAIAAPTAGLHFTKAQLLTMH